MSEKEIKDEVLKAASAVYQDVFVKTCADRGYPFTSEDVESLIPAVQYINTQVKKADKERIKAAREAVDEMLKSGEK